MKLDDFMDEIRQLIMIKWNKKEKSVKELRRFDSTPHNQKVE
jgi:hypothetical protein